MLHEKSGGGGGGGGGWVSQIMHPMLFHNNIILCVHTCSA